MPDLTKLCKWLVIPGLAAFSAGSFLLPAQTAAPTNGVNNNNNGAQDPGVRGGPPGAGGTLTNLTPQQLTMSAEGLAFFNEIDSVSGTVSGEPGSGLGPGFNLNSCAGCHAFPAVGGTSPQINPQVAVANLHGARNQIPSFITLHGPVREARFQQNSDGSADGGVHDLFVITGRFDAPPGCNAQQTNFQQQVQNNNVIFRIPTPTFGAGLMEAIEDSTILANKTANSSMKNTFGISGHENRSGNDGSITRFGWKAQNKSLLIFSGEAYNVEMGVTNEAFPNPRETVTGCDVNGHPEDHSDVTGNMSDITGFAFFMRTLAPPTPVTSYGDVSQASIQRGQTFFTQVGCALCHTPTLSSGPSSITALSHQTANLYSDLLVHNMGNQLADGISQGNAGPDEFRTAPLWGLGQRIFLLHDGRTNDLVQAIMAHRSQGSEANNSIQAFQNLNNSSTQDLLNFLRSL
jgi:CxxC motif-containing protein (DUF1111 family)